MNVKFYTTTDEQHPYGLIVDGNDQQFSTEQKRTDYLQWLAGVVANNEARSLQSARNLAAGQFMENLRHYEGEAIMAAMRLRDLDRGITPAQRLGRIRVSGE